MRAVAYERTGDPSVLRLVQRAVPEPGPGEVRVRVAVSGVNPTDVAFRSGAPTGGAMPFELVVPHHDGAGVVDALGPGVTGLAVGQRVWTVGAATGGDTGTAQELTCLPARQVLALPEGVPLEVGACLGVPAVTAVRALTVHQDGPARLTAGSLAGRGVLVAGGAGAVGHAAIQLARWAGAQVVATVSSAAKARLARAAGAHHVVRYADADAAAQVRRIRPGGVDLVCEVSLGANLDLDLAVLADGGAIAAYAYAAAPVATVPVAAAMAVGARIQFLSGAPADLGPLFRGAHDLDAPLRDGVLAVGEAAGLPLTRFPLERTADAHAALEAGAVGKVLVDV